MSTLTLVHATSARLHGQLLSGSHVWLFEREWLRGQIAARQAGNCACSTPVEAQRRGSVGGARAHDGGEKKPSSGEGVRSGREVLGKCEWGAVVVTAWWGDDCSVPGGTGRRMLKDPGSGKRGHGDVLLDRWSGRLGARPHRNSSVSAKQASQRLLGPGKHARRRRAHAKSCDSLPRVCDRAIALQTVRL